MWARYPRNLAATPFISDVMRDKSDRPIIEDATSRDHNVHKAIVTK